MKTLFYFSKMRSRRRYILDLVFIALFGLLFWKPFVFNVSTSFNVPIPLIENGFGLDVSHHQGRVIWDSILQKDKVLPKVDFIFLKASEGTDFLDPEFESNAESILSHNTDLGFYHFFRPNYSSQEQAVHFLSVTKGFHQDLPPVLDIETKIEKGTALIDSAKVWLDYVESTTGQRPIIYCPWSYYTKALKKAFPEHKFWVARYRGSIDISKDEQIIYWQFTDDAELPFHRTKVDLNVSSIKFN